MNLELSELLIERLEDKEVVRLTTSAWKDERGVYLRKSLTRVKRKSFGYQILYEDCSVVSPEEALERVANLFSCEDGLYVVVICNESKDWETGCVDDYDYKLIPYKP